MRRTEDFDQVARRAAVDPSLAARCRRPVPFGYQRDPGSPYGLAVRDDEVAILRMLYRGLVEEGRSIRAW